MKSDTKVLLHEVTPLVGHVPRETAERLTAQSPTLAAPPGRSSPSGRPPAHHRPHLRGHGRRERRQRRGRHHVNTSPPSGRTPLRTRAGLALSTSGRQAHLHWSRRAPAVASTRPGEAAERLRLGRRRSPIAPLPRSIAHRGPLQPADVVEEPPRPRVRGTRSMLARSASPRRQCRPGGSTTQARHRLQPLARTGRRWGHVHPGPRTLLRG